MDSLPHLEAIKNYLAALAHEVAIDNYGYGFYNINKYCEDCLSRVLGIVHRKNFSVLEYSKINETAIDIASSDNEIVYQITSENRASKIKDTLFKYLEKGYHEKYKSIRFLFLVTKYKPNTSEAAIINFLKNKKAEYGNISLDEIGFNLDSSVIDLSGLANLIKKNGNRNQGYPEVRKLLEDEFSYLKIRNISADKVFAGFLSSINSTLKTLPILSALHELTKVFTPINVFPKKILCKIYPLGDIDNEAKIVRLSLFMKNSKLFDEINSIFENLSESETDITHSEISEILHFFSNNHIHYIYLKEENKKIELGPYFRKTQCECERCLLEKFKYDSAIFKALDEIENDNHYEYRALRRAYSLYKLGDFPAAFKIYDELSKKAFNSKSHITYYLCEFNLRQLGSGIQRSKIEQSLKTKYIARVNSIDTDLILYSFYGSGVPAEKIEILKLINYNDFILSTFSKLNRLVERIRFNYYADKDGQLIISRQEEIEVYHELLEITIFAFGNLVIFDEYLDYKKIILFSFEGFLLLQGFSHIPNKRGVRFDNYLINLWIEASKPEDLNRIIENYGVKEVTFDLLESSTSNFIQKLESLKSSVYGIDSYLDLKVKKDHNYALKTKINHLVSNTLIFGRLLALSREKINLISSTVIDILKKFKHIEPVLMSEFNKFIRIRYDSLSDNTKSSLASLLALEKKTVKESMLSQLLIRKPFYKNKLSEKFQSDLKRVNTDLENDQSSYYLNAMFDYIDSLSEEERKEFSTALKKSLILEVTPRLLRQGVKHDIISYYDFEDRLLRDLNNKITELKENIKWYERQVVIPDIHNFVAIAYKINLKLDEERYCKINPGTPFYNWLFNLDDFDCEGFDPYWLFYCEDEEFVKKFRSSNILMAEIKSKMAEDFSPGVAKFFFDYLA